MAWDPSQYEKFRREREAPFLDLVALGAWRNGMRVLDLGCGTGELTARLLDLSPGAEVTGVDSSESMLARARALARPGLRFEQGRIETWEPRSPLDLVFSHAALHWVDDHPALFARLAGFLARGGQLLVQMPSNHGHVSPRLVQELAQEPPWGERLAGFVRRSPVLTVDAYAELLHRAGLELPVVIATVYGHVLADAGAVLEWQKGTLLVAYTERLSEEDGRAFLAALLPRFERAMPDRPYYYAFRRTLIAARKPS
ncbi:methyltransferase domain-containing protein [bacterium]|nr:methyltransferase domain-containing protein [bacterium]